MPNVWNTSYNMVGSVDSNGKVWDTSYNMVGSVDSDAGMQASGGAALLLLLIR
jgi:hypothetical protein